MGQEHNPPTDVLRPEYDFSDGMRGKHFTMDQDGDDVVVVTFEWRIDGSAENLTQHGVSFDEATTLYGSPFEVTIPDPDHSAGDNRFLSLGLSRANRLIVMAYAEQEGGNLIVHARQAAPAECRSYESGTKSED